MVSVYVAGRMAIFSSARLKDRFALAAAVFMDDTPGIISMSSSGLSSRSLSYK